MGEFNMTKKKRSRVSDNKQQTKTIVVKPAFVPHSNKAIQSYAHDGFANFVSRLGVGSVDNQLSEGIYELNLLTRNRMQLEAAYRGSWIVGAMIDSVAEDMTKAGVTISTSEGAKQIEDFQAGFQQLRIMHSLNEVIKWARLYGGAIGVMMIDGQAMDTPLKVDTIAKGQFTGLAVYDRWQLQPDLTTVIPSGPEIGLPAYYTIMTSADLLATETEDAAKASLAGGIRVHHTRVIRQIGVKLPFFQAITEQMWGMSELERIHDRLVSFDTATMSSANLINHANLRTVKVKDLREILSTGGKAEEGLVKMFEYMRLYQSSEGLTLLDGEDDFATNAYTFSGLSDMMLQFGQQLSGASGIPLVKLFGQSPAGLNSTGESDIRNYYDNINAQQEADLRPGVDRLIRVTWKSYFGSPCPSDMQFKFTPLWQMTAEQKANIGRTKAETIAGAHEAGLISKAISVKELRAVSSETGLFSNITDEDITEAEDDDDVPMPGDEPQVPEPIVEKEKTKDSIRTKIKKALGRK